MEAIRKTFATTVAVAGYDYDVEAQVVAVPTVVGEPFEHFGFRGTRKETEWELELESFEAFDMGGHMVFDESLLKRIERVIKAEMENSYHDILLS